MCVSMIQELIRVKKGCIYTQPETKTDKNQKIAATLSLIQKLIRLKDGWSYTQLDTKIYKTQNCWSFDKTQNGCSYTQPDTNVDKTQKWLKLHSAWYKNW